MKGFHHAILKRAIPFLGLDAQTLRFVAEREGNGTGFVLQFEISDKPQPGLNSMDYHESVTAGATSLLGGSGGTSLEHARSPEFFGGLGKAIHSALSEPPTQTVRISFSMTLGRNAR